MKTSELIDEKLDWAVSKAEGRDMYVDDCGDICFRDGEFGDYSTNWSQGGPIIEREIFKLFKNIGGTFTAQIKTRVSYYSPTYDANIGRDEVISRSGPTPLIAAMRCYCCAKLGDEIDIPEELQPCQQPNL